MTSALSMLRRAFQEACDPSAYVPRPPTEAVLAEIEAWLRPPALGPGLAVLHGAHGIGKTMLLRIAADRRLPSRQGEPRALYLPYAGLGPVDLCRWIHGSLGRREALETPSDAAQAFAALAALPGKGVAPFLLILDDADSMPRETLQMLRSADLGARPGHRLRMLLAVGDDARGTRLAAALQSQSPLELTLRERLSLADTADYVRGRLAWAGFSERDIGRVPDEAIGWIHALSSGLPRRIHRVASEILESESATLPGVLDEKRRREGWMGRPIQDDDEDDFVL